MIKHIVFWKIKEELEFENVFKEMQTLVLNMNGKIPGLLKVELGRDFNRSEPAFDVALYSELENKESLAIYQEHPVHQLVKKYIGSVTSERAVVDYEI